QRADEPPPHPTQVASRAHQRDRVVTAFSGLSRLVKQPERAGPIPDGQRVPDRRRGFLLTAAPPGQGADPVGDPPGARGSTASGLPCRSQDTLRRPASSMLAARSTRRPSGTPCSLGFSEIICAPTANIRSVFPTNSALKYEFRRVA